MDEPDALDFESLTKAAHLARAAHRFADAYEAFSRADQAGDLSTDDVLAWSDAAWWLGRPDEALELAELGHHRLLGDDQPIRAAMEAIGLGFLLMLRGELASGSGWMHRGRSLLEESGDDHSTGYLLHLDAEEALESGDIDRAVDLARRAGAVARRAADPALTSLALMTEGTALLRAGAEPRAMALLDEAMLPVQAGRVAPEFAGNLYCQMIDICWQLADLRRAREWTVATERWCEQFDSSVMFSGICRMHRVQLRQVSGAWDEAAMEAEVVCNELVGMNVAVVAEGHYLRGDLLRLRGSVEQAETAYGQAHALGRDPQPGLALLHAQRGEPARALTSLHTALAAYGEPDYRRAPLLRAVVEVAIDLEDLDAATQAADELSAIAEQWRTDGLRTAAEHAQGAVALSLGEVKRAIAVLSEVVRQWHELEAPYDAARTRLLLSRACLLLGDDAAARREAATARATFERLGATTDLANIDMVLPREDAPGGLTPREAEVLAIVAEGGTNREVADELVISEKTVARHLANTYLKLGVSTRTAAADWARRNGIRRPTA